MNRKLLNGFIVLLAAICCPLSVIMMVAGGSFAVGAAQGYQEPEQVEIEVEVPGFTAEIEEVYPIEIQVTNLADEAQTLDSIDINSAFLEGFVIEGSVPPYTQAESYFGFESHYYGRSIDPGNTLTVELGAVARQTGRYPLLVDVCINEPMSCATYEFANEIVVK
jgi:hypothetical protein